MTAARSLATPRPTAAPDGSDPARIARAAARIPDLSGMTYYADRLPGGLTNTNYRLTFADGRRCVVRLSTPQSALLAIDRDAEHANSRAAAQAGVAPAVLGYSPDVGALVIDWIEGRTFAAADLDDGATLAAVAAACRHLHSGPRFACDFDMFDLQRRYLDLVMRRGYRLPDGYLEHSATVAAIRDAIRARPLPSVPCHNDLLAANIMASHDGVAERIWFVDFEYAGNGDPYFELGNIASESLLPVTRLAELVTAYSGVDSPALLARARLHSLMSDYGWTLWASIQDATSDLDFDFWSWGMAKYHRACEAFTDPDLPGLINDVQHVGNEGEGP